MAAHHHKKFFIVTLPLLSFIEANNLASIIAGFGAQLSKRPLHSGHYGNWAAQPGNDAG